jgi:hypothetical protein
LNMESKWEEGAENKETEKEKGTCMRNDTIWWMLSCMVLRRGMVFTISDRRCDFKDYACKVSEEWMSGLCIEILGELHQKTWLSKINISW